MRFAVTFVSIFCFFHTAFCTSAVEIESDGLLAETGSQIPVNGIQENDNFQIAAYIQGALDAKFPHNNVIVTVRNGMACLTNLSSNSEQGKAILTYVRELTSKSIKQPVHNSKHSGGIWFPESTVLYPSQVANPRQLAYSCALRISDKITGHWAAPVSFADRFPMYRWTNIWGGDVQLELEGGVFSVFNLSKGHYPLINTDYYVGLPITLAKGDWRYRARLYHVSSHLGDEYMKSHRHIHRKNKSFEATDFSCAYYVLPEWYFFTTLGTIYASDSEFNVGTIYVDYGFEVRGEKKVFDQLFRQPFLSVFCRNSQENHFNQDLTMALGYEWGKVTNVGRLLRAFLEYHQGFSQEGQFSHKKSDYLALKLSYGF